MAITISEQSDPGKDGAIRGAQILASNRNGGKVDLYRPVQKLYPLEVSAMTETQNKPKEVQAAIDADCRRILGPVR